MRWIFLTLLGTFTLQAHATDLYCQGTAWTETGQSFDDSRVLNLDKEKSEISVNTFFGIAKGIVKKDSQLYIGFLYAPQSITYWINLDRYSGSFVLVTAPSDGKLGRAEFIGTCKQRTPQF